MEQVTLGRTGLEVGVVGLGCGGHSRLGQARGASAAESERLVSAALDLGITLVDTAAVYGTEEIVGRAIAARRADVVLSTKIQIVRPGSASLGDDFIGAGEFMAAAEASLRRLGTDRVDILHLHGVAPAQYDYARDELVPALQRLKDDGKVRFTGLTERFIVDPGHAMLGRALSDGCWDVVMAGHNMINPSAGTRVFAPAHAQGIATLAMFAVRRALADPQAIRELVAKLVDAGLVGGRAIDRDDPLGFLLGDGGAASVVEAAYRYCRHTAGVDVVLTGTGSLAHLRQNLASINTGPLPPPALARLERLFGHIDTETCE